MHLRARWNGLGKRIRLKRLRKAWRVLVVLSVVIGLVSGIITMYGFLYPQSTQNTKTFTTKIFTTQKTLLYSTLVRTVHEDRWSEPKQLTVGRSEEYQPSISQDSGGKIWVFFVSDMSGKPQIYYMTSADKGQTWFSPEEFVAAHENTEQTIDETGYPMVGSPSALFEDSRGKMWIAWQRWTAPSQSDIWYSSSEDMGMTWSDKRCLISYPDDDTSLSFLEDGNEIWIVWRSFGISFNWDIWYAKTIDSGTSWTSPKKVTSDGLRHDYCRALKDSQGIIWIFYTGLTSPYEPETAEIYYKTTWDKGASWLEQKQVTFAVSEKNIFDVAESDTDVFVFYTNRYDPNIWYVTSSDGGLTWSSTSVLSPSPGYDGNPSAYSFGKDLWVVWESDRTGNMDIWYSSLPTLAS